MNFRFISVALSLVAFAPVQARGAIPAQLAAAIERYGCAEILNKSDFMNLRGDWWVPLKEFTGSDADFAFFCHDKNDRMATRFIVEAKGGNNPWKACRPTIQTWQGLVKPHLPISLEVVTTSSRYSRISDLGIWWLVDSTRNTQFTFGPTGTRVPDLVIDTTGQSAGGVYACYDGKWYTIGLD